MAEYYDEEGRPFCERYNVAFIYLQTCGFVVKFFLYLIVGSNILGTVIMQTNERRQEFTMKRFRVACVQSEQRMNDVLEVLMEYFVANGVPISKEKSD